MPTPQVDENKNDFISRCIPIVLEDGTADNQEQAVAVCNSMWEDATEKEGEMSEENKTLDKEKQEEEEQNEKGMHEAEEIYYDIPFGIKSFAELDAFYEAKETSEMIEKTNDKFAALSRNIFSDPEIEDKPAALAALAQEFAEIITSPDEMKETKDDDGLVKTITNKVGEMFGLKKKEEQPADNSGFMLWKEADGLYHWIARYSNNIRDDDNPPEIISAKSHQRFVEMVDNKEADLPELWLWHVPEWKWGEAQWVAYDDSGFALAGGVVNKGFEPLAESIMELSSDEIRVSHGMPTNSIVRDDEDPSIIVEHKTREISPLPAWAAANSRTGFIIQPKEVQSMAIPKDKQDTLKTEWNLSETLLGNIETANAAEAKEAEEAGLEAKEKDDNDAQSGEEIEQQTEQQEEPESVTRDELAGLVEVIGQQLTNVNTQVGELANAVKELQSAREKEKEETLTDLFQRAAGHEQAKVDGRTSLAKQKPAETQPEGDQPQIIATGNPMVDSMVSSIVSGQWREGIDGEEARQ